MTAGLDVASLRRVLGDDAVAGDAGIEVDGAKIAVLLRPAGGEQLSAALRLLGEAGRAALVRGGGTRLTVGNPPRAADALLSSERLAGIAELDSEEGVVRAGAGTPLGDLREAAEAVDWELPLESPGAGATVGGAIASAAIGPRLLGYGPPRDCVLGLRVCLATGERTRCGGRVVKNVTGYDLMKLHTGGFGTLGVIEEAWLRLRPRPEERLHGFAWLPEGDPGWQRGAEVAALASARAVALVDPALASQVVDGGLGAGRCLLVVELAGARETLQRDRARLSDLDLTESDATLLDRIAVLQQQPDARGGLRFRVSARPTRLAPAAAPLVRAGATVLALPGSGFLYAGFPLYDGADELVVDAACRAAREAARAGLGSYMLEAAPPWAKTSRDVFGDAPPALAVMRALKQRFDPGGVLNPGRFVGGL